MLRRGLALLGIAAIGFLGSVHAEAPRGEDAGLVVIADISDILWTRDSDLWLMKGNGNNQQLLLEDGEHPNASPNGLRIAFRRGFVPDIYIMNADTSAQDNLTAPEPESDSGPKISPDGTKIAFNTFRDGNAEVYVMGIDGGDVTNVSNHPGIDVGPTWSPDSQQIAFASQRAGQSDIWVANTDGSNPTNVTPGPANESSPAWSPDGSYFLFTRAGGGTGDDIYRIDADGGNEMQLTSAVGGDVHPAWAPEGDRIAFTSRRDGNDEIYWMRPDGSDQTRLTTNPAQDWLPEWKARPKGDANCDAFVTAVDAALVLQLSAGLILVVPCGLPADVNDDGQRNSLDAALILQYTAGLLAKLPP